jgi:LysR family transcriptional regulator, hydrogen peroxide-inducible genes activator
VTLTELRYLVALAQDAHFGRAAERCHVSQPTLSIAIRKLEEELGVPLFERAKQSVTPTPLGQKIVALATQVIDQVARIKDLAESDHDQLTGRLALGTLPTIGPYLLPQFIPLLQELAPNLSLYVEEASQAELTAKLRAGDIDVALLCLPSSDVDIVAQALFDEPFVLLLPSSHPLAGKLEITAEDLRAEEVLLLRDGHEFRSQVLSSFPHLQTTVDQPAITQVQGSTLETLRHMVASRLGVTILPMAAAQMPLYTGKVLTIRKFKEPAPARTLALAWRASFPRHKAIDVLRRAVQASSTAYWNYNTVPDPDRPIISVENSDW